MRIFDPCAETRQSLLNYWYNLSSHLFILHPGEYVTKVEVCYTDEVVTAIKLFTSLRVTPWYGETNGTRATLEAEDGFCINALRGRYGPDGCSEFGVVFAPKEIAKEGHSLDSRNVETRWSFINRENRVWPTAVRTFSVAPSAIVVTTDATSVRGVRVVTSAEYDRIARFPDSFKHEANEQWFILVEGERLKAVGLEIQNQCLKAIRFRTSLQTSHSYGEPSAAPIRWLAVDGEDDGDKFSDSDDDDDSDDDNGTDGVVDPNKYIGGFEVEADSPGNGGAITKIGILCLSRPPDSGQNLSRVASDLMYLSQPQAKRICV